MEDALQKKYGKNDLCKYTNGAPSWDGAPFRSLSLIMIISTPPVPDWQ